MELNLGPVGRIRIVAQRLGRTSDEYKPGNLLSQGVFVDIESILNSYGVRVDHAGLAYVIRYIGFLDEGIDRKSDYHLIFVPSETWLQDWLDSDDNKDKLADGGKNYELIGKLSDLIVDNDRRLKALKAFAEYELIGDVLVEQDPDIFNKVCKQADAAIKGVENSMDAITTFKVVVTAPLKTGDLVQVTRHAGHNLAVLTKIDPEIATGKKPDQD